MFPHLLEHHVRRVRSIAKQEEVITPEEPEVLAASQPRKKQKRD